MTYPALSDLTTFIIVLSMGVPLVLIFSNALKLHPQTIMFSKKREEAFYSLLVFAAVIIATFGIYGFYDRVWIRPTLTADPLYVLRDGIWIALILLPVVAALRLSRQTFGSIAANRGDIKKNLALGMLTSIVLLSFIGILSPSLGGGFVGFSIPVVYLLMSCVIIGLGEETIFRGYIQTRLTANRGAVAGIGATSLFFVMYNFPLGYFCFSGNIQLSILFAMWRLSSGLLYGYTFHRSQNLIPSSILHIFLVWGGLMFGLYL